MTMTVKISYLIENDKLTPRSVLIYFPWMFQLKKNTKKWYYDDDDDIGI